MLMVSIFVGKLQSSPWSKPVQRLRYGLPGGCDQAAQDLSWAKVPRVVRQGYAPAIGW
ncbi:hypothetical protein PSAC2689_100008 [Paraburkholderia sacchari]